MDHFAEKHDLELARTESKFRKDYPLIAERLDYLESIAHPKCGLDGFDDYQPLIDRIEALEKSCPCPHNQQIGLSYFPTDS